MIGFIGLGVMGFNMSKRLIESGYELIVNDIDPRPVSSLEAMGAHKGYTPREVSSRSNITISMLPSPMATKEVVLGQDGALLGFQPGSIYVDMSTSNPIITKEICLRLQEREVEMLDAPVSGGTRGAKDGTLTIMVGGKREISEKVEPVFNCLGKRIFYVGEIGTGHTLKLINNMLFSVIMAATAEALVFGKRAGIDPVALREIVNKSSGSSYAMETKVRDYVLPRNFAPGFAVDLQNKDLDLALQLAKELGTPLVLATLVRQLYQTLILKGYGKKDTSIIVSFFEENMGVGNITEVGD